MREGVGKGRRGGRGYKPRSTALVTVLPLSIVEVVTLNKICKFESCK